MTNPYGVLGMRRFTVPPLGKALLLTAAAALSGCFTEVSVLHGPDGGAEASSDDAAVTAHADADADAGPWSAPSTAAVHAKKVCAHDGSCRELQVNIIDKLDLLFMIDDSNSMREEQNALKAQLPKLVATLTSGKRSFDNPDGPGFAPIRDVHVAVVTSDMGLIGVNGIKGCSGFGDDGVMRDPMTRACNGSVPGQRFLSYKAGVGTEPTVYASNVGCLMDVGTGGCGFEQQLESTLKAVWPKTDVDNATGVIHEPNRVAFLRDSTGAGGDGHGDQENAGFLRNSLSEGQSMIAIVLVTDEEDCSSNNTNHFKLMSQLAPDDPNDMVDLNLRCFKNPQELYSVQDRYVQAFKALRPGREELVVFGAIVGVPPSTVDSNARAGVDFDDDDSRNAYYDKILDDAHMQNVVDVTRAPGDGNLRPSCDTATGKAYPPRRIVEVAKQMGKNSFVQSICNEDFGPAVDPLIDLVAHRGDPRCLPKNIERTDMGFVSCDLIWELPKQGEAPSTSPTECDDKTFLHSDPAYPSIDGHKLCVMSQLNLSQAASGAQDLQGWYYDDFSMEEQQYCGAGKSWITYTAEAKTPTGVRTYLDCHATK